MPRNYQIIPKNNFPTEEVYVNDNTTVSTQLMPNADGTTSYLLVVSSPKGRDGIVQQIKGQAEFMDKIGLGPFSLYGQPLLTAYALASTGKTTLNILRVAASDATYASVHVCAKYKVDETNKMTVKFTANQVSNLTKLDALDTAYTVAEGPDAEGFTEVKLFSVACLGRGLYGNNYRFNIETLTQQDRENEFKNYAFNIYENEGGVLNMKETFHVCFNENALIGTTTYFADSVIMSPDSGSELVNFVSYPEGFNELFKAYTQKNETTLTFNDFDFLLGINKYTKTKIENYEIVPATDEEGTDSDAIVLNALDGIAFMSGSDGALGVNQPAESRNAVLEQLYRDAYSGEIDPMIVSKNKFPTHILPDANFSVEIKKLIHALSVKRGDCVALFDAGITGIANKKNVVTWVKENLGSSFTDTYESVDAYYGKVRDPYNQKIVTVTSVYALCLLYANSFYASGGAKHIPVADRDEGNLDQIFIKDTIAPLFDEDIDTEVMNELVDERINFARYNAAGKTNRSSQTTRQEKLSMLSELNNVFILKDVKRKCEKMCAGNRYNFADPDDLSTFNTMANMNLAEFGNQVISIKASVGQSAYEKDYSIVHLYVDMACRNLVKTTIIEIDVNRA